MSSNQFQFDPIYRLLALSARINPDEHDQKKLSQAFSSFNDWGALITEAENNAIAPLLYTSLRETGIPLPIDVKRKLYALVQRHRWANDARAKAMAEIAEACKNEMIQLVVLKGSYLAHALYPDPSLRTMSDIDLLAPPERAADVQQILRDLGYSAPEQSGNQYLSEHHHLPGAHIERDGVPIHVEIHRDALSGDTPASITTNNLTSPLKAFSIEDVSYFSLGHQDQLRHLYHHMSEPAQKLKLIWCVDIMYYASHYEKDINWDELARNYPRVINALKLVDFIIPFPANLRCHFPTEEKVMPPGTGISILPLSSILHKPIKQRLNELLVPSSWWLRLYYGVSPNGTLIITKLVKHPWRIFQWILRRIRASRQ